MGVSLAIRDRIDHIVNSNAVVLFMKGGRGQPQCGFSATVVGILDLFLQEYVHIDVLQDEGLRQGIKEYANWPTIPQLYAKGQFVGGCDIIKQIHAQGQLFDVLGVDKPAPCEPNVAVTQSAQEALTRILQEANEGEFIRLQVDARGLPSLKLELENPCDVHMQQGNVMFLLDPLSASRAQGLKVDYVQEDNKSGFSIRYS